MEGDKRAIIYISIAYVVGIILGIILGIMIGLDNSREVIDELIQENNKLETILNNYTIEESKGELE